MRFEFAPVPDWPPLAWLASCSPGGQSVAVFHGSMVECTPDWFCEAVWPGRFGAGDFDRTDLVFGSGGRLRPDGVTFVSSGSTVDRLQTLETAQGVCVSNSLACLLAAVGGRPDPTDPRYFQFFRSSIRGLRKYKRILPTSAGPVRLAYFHNLAWDGRSLREETKPAPVRDFSSFSRYRDFLTTSLCEIAANMSSGERTHRWAWLGTISSGYDSATIAALARAAGLRDVISFDRARSGSDDTGSQIAALLGLSVSVVPREAWCLLDMPEIPFLAADAKGEEVHYTAAQSALAGRVLLTGFHGDTMWDRHMAPLSDDLGRGDQCGLSLTEYRLWTGFIHCPVPFFGAQQIRAVNAISRSREMAPWSVGGAYNRPICRRILEEAGVPRGLFGVAKKYTSVLLFDRRAFLSARSWRDYSHWLVEHASEWWRRGHAPPPPARQRVTPLRSVSRGLARALHTVANVAPVTLWWVNSLAWRSASLGSRERLFRHVFPWALERAAARYRLSDHGSAGTPEAGTIERRPFVSVIVPCRNEERFIEKCLDSIATSDYPRERLEVLVVDGMSDDGTREIVARCAARNPAIRLVDNPKRITPSALNIGIRAARGDAIVRMDAHGTYPPDYISRSVAALEQTGADNVGGVILTLPADDTPVARAIAVAVSHPFGVGDSHFRIGSSERRWVHTLAFGCFRREVFARVGLFDEELARNQDDEFNFRLVTRGGRVLLDPRIVASYYARRTLGQAARMFYQYGYFKPLVARKVGRVMSARHLLPALFVLSLATSALLAPWVAAARPLVAAIVGTYLAGAAASAALSIRRLRLAGALVLPAVFALVHFGYGLGFLRGVAVHMLGLGRRAENQRAVASSR